MTRFPLARVAILLFFALSLAPAGRTADEPPPPAASAGLEGHLRRLIGPEFQPKQAPEALRQLDEIERQLPPDAGPVDRAIVRSVRAELLFLARRNAESVREALAATADWRTAGDGPGEVEALALAGLQEYARSQEEGRRLMTRAIELANQETRRPEAAGRALNKTGMIATAQGAFDATTFDPETFNLDRLQPGLLSPTFTEPAVLLLTAAAEHLEQREPSAYRLVDWWDSAGMAAYFGGDLPTAQKLQERALAVEVRERTPREVVSRLLFLGHLTRMEGDFRASREYFTRALRLQEEKSLGQLESTETWTQLGILSMAEGDVAAARDAFQTAWHVRAEAKADTLLLAESLLNLSLTTALQGDPEGGQTYGKKALELLTSEPPTKDRRREYALTMLRSRVLNNLGLAALTLGRFDEAHGWFQQVWDLQKERAPESGDAALALFNLGTVELQANHPQQAADNFRRALAIYRRPGGDLGGQALCLANLGLAAVVQKDLNTAAQSLQQAREIQERHAPASNDLALTLHSLALVRYLQENPAEAARLEERAWALTTAQTVAPAEGRGEQPTLTTQTAFANALGLYRYRLGQLGPAFEAVEAGRVWSLQRLAGERKALLNTAAGDTWTRYERVLAKVQLASDRLVHTVNAERATAENLPSGNDATASPEQRALAEAALARRKQDTQDAREAYLRVLGERDQLSALVRKQAPRVFPTPLTLVEARAALPPNSLAASFAVGDRDTLLFLLRPTTTNAPGKPNPGTGLTVTRIAITPAELKREVEELRGAVTARGGSLEEATAAGRQLFRRLFPGAAGTAVSQASRLLLSPDAMLWDVPFAALVTNPAGKPAYLGEVPLRYTQSLTLLRELQSPPPARTGAGLNALIAGNPRFSTKPGQAMASEREFLLNGRPPAPLPGTQAEATRIAALYDTTALTGAAATEEAVRKRLGQADVVHLATHGFLQPGRAMSSGLLLSTPEDTEKEPERSQDGVLQAWEIFGELKLRADLVVLSACETARGSTSPGDGLVGLTRALQFAGGRSVIASQWRVSDASTGTLMVALHRKLRSGLPKDRALAEAMATLRKAPETAHPYYWAPFILVGDVENHLGRRGASHRR